ncbi:MAG: peptidyl-prolyl cis-trans isomerase [Candidatus Sumerlaeaceae bacterium]|nr:peptidyl-prolyl cis-trans isomerase [Candidatus Sumerlaeaceae bacterium]
MMNHVRKPLLSRCALAAVLLLGCYFYGQMACARPTQEDIKAYGELYKASVIRSIRFADQVDPDESIREEIFLEAELAKKAEKEGVTTDPLLQADIRYYQTQEILSAWLEKRLPQDAVTTTEVEQFYREHRTDFTTTEMVKFRHIFFMVPQGEEKVESEKLAQARRVKEKLDAGEDFGLLAAEFSDLASAKRNKGLVGPEKLSRLNPAIQDALRRLKPGEISEPVRTRYGWEILQLVERIPERVRPLGEVHDEIRNQLRRNKALELQDRLSSEVKHRFPAQINDTLLETSPPLPRQEWVFAVAGTTHTVETALADAYACWAYHDIADEVARLRAALPRLILTAQLLAAARTEGILTNAHLQAKLRFISNRLTAERYWRNLRPKKEPTEKELRDHHAENPDIFRTPPEAKGVLFVWQMDKLADGTTQSGAFLRESLRRKVEALRAQAVKGELTRDALREAADQTQELDWFREGPHGYFFDKAFFSVPAQSYTPVFPHRDGYAFGWVEARKDPQRIPFDECREWVRRRLVNIWADQEREKLLEEILSRYARLQQ